MYPTVRVSVPRRARWTLLWSSRSWPARLDPAGRRRRRPSSQCAGRLHQLVSQIKSEEARVGALRTQLAGVDQRIAQAATRPTGSTRHCFARAPS
jgi:hypothetical protein